jgi:hypothetical protein
MTASVLTASSVPTVLVVAAAADLVSRIVQRAYSNAASSALSKE